MLLNIHRKGGDYRRKKKGGRESLDLLRPKGEKEGAQTSISARKRAFNLSSRRAYRGKDPEPFHKTEEEKTSPLYRAAPARLGQKKKKGGKDSLRLSKGKHKKRRR